MINRVGFEDAHTSLAEKCTHNASRDSIQHSLSTGNENFNEAQTTHILDMKNITNHK